jgi:phosphonate dehydrogenase
MRSRPKVVITHWVHPEVLHELSSECDLVANRSLESLPRELLLERTRDARAILAFMPDRIDSEFLDRCPKLGIVAGAFKGFDNIEVDACTARGVCVTVVPDLLTEPTAELAVGLLLSVARHLREGDAVVRRGAYRGWRPILYSPGLGGRSVGLVGMGAVGQAIATRLSGFSCRLLYHDPIPLPPERERALRIERATFEDLLSRSDHVVLAAPLTAATRGMLGAGALSAMKAGATLVNIGRGSLVEEQAVAEALRSGRLGGYAADVFACEDLSLSGRPGEPPSELLAPGLRTVFTPHLGSAVDDARLAIARSAAGSILEFLRGQVPAHAVNRPPARASGAFDERRDASESREPDIRPSR